MHSLTNVPCIDAKYSDVSNMSIYGSIKRLFIGGQSKDGSQRLAMHHAEAKGSPVVTNVDT